MPGVVRIGLLQTKWDGNAEAAIAKHERMIDEAASKGCQIVCLHELFSSPFFTLEQDAKWYDLAEPVPGPLITRMQKKAREQNMVLIVPIYEKDVTGIYYNTAVVIDADGAILGKYRKSHIPHDDTGWEKFYFKPGDLGYPVFQTKYAKIGICICYDRYFPEGWRTLGLNGAEIVFNPSQTIVECARFWEVMQPAHALANGYFVATVNRVGVESGWRFAGRSYVCNPRAEIYIGASGEKEELVVADCALAMIKEARHLRTYYHDRRPETYGKLIE